MPVRSLSSSVLKWPDARTVERALRGWVEDIRRKRPELLLAGYMGSYARGDWGFGSDLDIIVVVETAAQPFARRAVGWDVTALPVPADLLIYTLGEWMALPKDRRFYRTMQEEAVWLYAAEPLASRFRPHSSSR